ncbi:MAG: hypothetical protein QJQ54_03325 [Mollicutes bacterium]|nr:MAG: hypothetical protein QJQ54_03325 [Mollicutes bacterium]
MAKIKVFSLGGLDEVGKNCIVIEVNEQIFIFDSGLKYLNNIDLGINSVIPDFSFLIENQKKIRGLFLSKIETSKAHSISYLLKKIPHLTVYLTATSKEILKGLNLLTEQQINKNLHVLNDQHLQFNNVKLQMFSTATSMPGSCGYILSTQDGDIVYTGSIVIKSKFNTNLFSTDLSGLIKEKPLPTLLLIQNVEEVATEGFTVPNNRIDN